MRDPARIYRVMFKIETLWVKHPDLRFFQFMTWLKWSMIKENYIDIDPFSLEDDILEKILDKMLNENNTIN